MRAYFVAATLFSAGYAFAGTPAEMPPEDFQQTAFVDSAGCAFMRAEINGETTWIARRGADRQPICDEIPTFAPGDPAPVLTDQVVVSLPQKPAPAPVMTKKVAQGVPNGFKPAWDDGRLNPERGPRTAAGDAAMYEIWSDGVPMERK